MLSCVFFFQAEDGIRDGHVTGVQTCALPIYHFLLPSELPRQVISEAGCLHLTAWSFFTDPPRAAAREAARIARQAGVPISFDPASFQMIHETGLNAFLKGTADLGISVLLPNYEEGNVLTGETEPEAIAVRPRSE